MRLVAFRKRLYISQEGKGDDNYEKGKTTFK